MLERNKYREMIASRKEKERALTDILAQDKIDIAVLQAAVEAAISNKVDDKFIVRAREKLQWLGYCKEVEN